MRVGYILAENPYAVKEVDKTEDFDVNRCVASCFAAHFDCIPCIEMIYAYFVIIP